MWGEALEAGGVCETLGDEGLKEVLGGLELVGSGLLSEWGVVRRRAEQAMMV